MSSRVYKITSPLAGTFYQASSPEELPLVKVGQEIHVGEVLCIIESMKVFTELRAEMSGIVTRILVEDEDSIMRNQELMVVEVA